MIVFGEEKRYYFYGGSTMITSGILVILIVLLGAVLVLAILGWYFLRPTSKKQTTSDVKTQPIVQRFVSNNLKKRAFIMKVNEGGYKVVYQGYSEEIINRAGEVAGWQTLPDKPSTDSLAMAVELAKSWVHADE